MTPSQIISACYSQRGRPVTSTCLCARAHDGATMPLNLR